MPAVEFNVHCETTMGEKVVVVGSGDAAGLWDPQRSLIKLDTNSEIYPYWAGTTDLPKGFTFEYKFAVLSSSDGPARWEQLTCNRSLEVPDIAAKLLANFDCPNEQVELACAEQIPSRTDALEDADAATSATPALAGTAPAGMTMATAPAVEATNVKIEAAKAKEAAAEELEKLAEVEVVKAAAADKVEEAPRVAAESTQSAMPAEELARAEESRKVKAPIEDELAMGEKATEIAKVQKAPKAQEVAKTREAAKVAKAKVVEAVRVAEGTVKAVPAPASPI